MKIDRAAVLTLTVTLATVACTAGTDDAASSSDGVVAGSACVIDGDEAAPVAEGRCAALYEEAMIAGVKKLSSAPEGASVYGCSPELTEEPCGELGFIMYEVCSTYALHYRKRAALDAITCLERSDLSDPTSATACGFAALSKSCGGTADAKAFCDAVKTEHEGLSVAETNECLALAGGLRTTARAQILAAARHDDAFTFHSAVEGLDPFSRAEAY